MNVCVSVDKDYGEYVRRILVSTRVFDRRYRVYRNNDKVVIPVISREEALKALEKTGIPFEIIECSPPLSNKLSDTEKPPAHDYIGGVAIVRENVLKQYSVDKLVDILRKLYPKIKSIYVKKGTETDYRLSVLELLWGEPVREVIHREYGIKMYIELGKVYYNPRLSTEHYLVSQEIEDGEFIVDLFSGIGGFTLHIAVNKKAIIHANDINPYAIKCLLKSIVLNKKAIKSTIIVTQLDSRNIPDFLDRGIADRIIANLPHKSIEFVDVYNYLGHRGTILYLYIVGSSIDELIDEIRSVFRDQWKIIGYRRVIDYSPYKYIYRIKLAKV